MSLEDFIEFHRHELMQDQDADEERQWLKWVDQCEKLYGGDIDGGDGVSLDDAYDSYLLGKTPEQYIDGRRLT